MALHFDPKIGLYPDEITTVRETVRADWVAAFQKDGLPPLNTEPEAPAGQLCDSQTAAIVDKDNEVLFLANQFNPLTAEGIWQDALGKIYFLTRKGAQPSEALCECTGLGGTLIPAGCIIESSADGSRWRCAESVTIPGGTSGGNVQARFIALEAGPLAAGAGTLTQIITVVPGWDAVTNPAPAIVGRVEETQAEFEARRYASVAANARGSLYAIYGALADLDGVIDCVVLENTTNNPVVKWGVTIPGHSIWASVLGGEDAAIAETIYRKKDAGCGTSGGTEVTYQDMDLPGTPVYNYEICRPAPVSFGVKVVLRKTDGTPADIEDQIKQAVLADFNGQGVHGNLRVAMAQTVFASRFYCPVISAGAQGLESIELAFPYAAGAAWLDSVTINADQAPALSEENIIVEILNP